MRFSTLVAMAKAGLLEASDPKGGFANTREYLMAVMAPGKPDERLESIDPPYLRDGSGVAIIPVEGAMMKEVSKFGGSSTIQIRRGLRAAAADPDVKAILLAIDSPGGTVAGMTELTDAVSAANRQKPVYAQINDLGASAAYWMASQTRSISANKTALVGSIGTVAIVEDSSKAYEMAGVVVHVVSTGDYKGAFADGAPVTEEQLADLQATVDGVNAFFLAGVSQGRGMAIADVKAVADGRLHLADDAQALGLVDHVRSMDATLEAIRADIAREASRTSVARRMDASKRRAVREALDIT